MTLITMRQWLRTRLLKAGWDVRRVASVERLEKQRLSQVRLQRWRFLQRYGIRTVLDIGANTGQFAELVRSVLPTAALYSFEPLADCHAMLLKSLERLQPAKAFQIALGEDNGSAEIERNEFRPSSSLLPMCDLHRSEAPYTAKTVRETITVRRLDDVMAEQKYEQPLFVKIDVQGFEGRVLRGGERTIRSAAAVMMEASTYKFYEGQSDFDELYQMMRDWGFAYRGNADQWLSQKDGRILQFDALFENLDLCD